MWVSMCFSRALDSYFIVKKPPYSLAKIATRVFDRANDMAAAETRTHVGEQNQKRQRQQWQQKERRARFGSLGRRRPS